MCLDEARAGYASANVVQCRAYHAGQNYYVEVDIVMDEDLPLKVTHDVSQTLQRKLEGMSTHLHAYEKFSFSIGLADVERAYVHVDYEDEHDIKEEHKPLYEVTQKRTIKEKAKALFYLFQKKDAPS
jgi:hypothetical protein